MSWRWNFRLQIARVQRSTLVAFVQPFVGRLVPFVERCGNPGVVPEQLTQNRRIRLPAFVAERPWVVELLLDEGPRESKRQCSARPVGTVDAGGVPQIRVEHDDRSGWADHP